MKKKEYRALIEHNEYINQEAVVDFLRNNCIADFEVIAEVFNKGMSNDDYYNLQDALDDLETA